MTIRDIAWFAALFEGEGAVCVEHTKLVPRIHVEMCDEDVVQRAARITGGYVYRAKPRHHANPKWQDVYRLVVNGTTAIGWLMTIYPFLGIRRRAQVREALTYWRHRVRQPGGWTAHRARYGCRCQRLTGSCQRLSP